MSAREEWVAKTGLPPHLFEASREELAYRVFETQIRIDNAITERFTIENTILDPHIMRDALKWNTATTTREKDLKAALVAEWERKR